MSCKSLLFVSAIFALVSDQMWCAAAVKVTVYADKNFRGPYQDIEVNGCTSVPTGWNDVISSIDSHGNCVLLWKDGGCNTKSLQIGVGRGPANHYDLKALGFNDVTSSISPCPSDVTENFDSESSPQVHSEPAPETNPTEICVSPGGTRRQFVILRMRDPKVKVGKMRQTEGGVSDPSVAFSNVRLEVFTSMGDYHTQQ